MLSSDAGIQPESDAKRREWEALNAYNRLQVHAHGDERFLGDSESVASVLPEQIEPLAARMLQKR